MKHTAMKIVAAILFATPSVAGTSMVNGSATGTDKSQFIPTGEATGVLNFLIDFEPYTSADRSDPLVGAHGPCFGLGKVAGGFTAGEGYCHFKDLSEEQIVLYWSMEPTMEVRGTWQIVGGTGKWEKAVGGGFFHDTPGEAGGPAVTHFAGELTFAD